MPCLGDAWDAGLKPGTPEYALEESKVHAQLVALMHVVNYYCEQHGRDATDLAGMSPSDSEELSRVDRDLLKGIYHHLRCDGINASVVYDILRLAEIGTTEERSLLPILRTCAILIRSGIKIEKEKW